MTGTKEEDIVTLRKFFEKGNWKEELEEMGANGLIAVKNNYSRRKLADDYIKILNSLVITK